MSRREHGQAPGKVRRCSPQHPVALVPSPPERQRLVLIEELLQVGGRGGMGGAEVEGAEASVSLCTNERANEPSCMRLWISPCSKMTGFLSARACLISIWQ